MKLGLKDDEATRALYPFSFSLTLEYSVGAGGLKAVAEVTNTGAPMADDVPPEPSVAIAGYFAGRTPVCESQRQKQRTLSDLAAAQG